MELTDIVIRNMSNAGKLKAVVSCTFDHVFVVHDVKVISSSQGLFIAMPSRKTPNGNFIDIAHPIRTEFRNYLSELILSKYEEQNVADEDVVEIESASIASPINDLSQSFLSADNQA